MAGKKTYTINENIFENIDTEEKAYWLGFLLADGSIHYRPRQKTIKLSLQAGDKDHLVKFRKFLGSTHPIKEYNYETFSCCELSFSNDKMANDLAKYGIVPKKSLTVSLPIIGKNLEKHILRGIWDGDGSVLFRATHSKYPKNLRPEVQLCGNKYITGSIQNILINNVNVNKTKIHPVSSIFLFRYTGIPARKIINYLYKDSKIYLNRKMEKAILGMGYVSIRERG